MIEYEGIKFGKIRSISEVSVDLFWQITEEVTS